MQIRATILLTVLLFSLPTRAEILSAGAQPTSVLENAKPIHGTVEKTREGVKLVSISKKDRASLQTDAEYKTPLIITTIAQTDTTSLRLHFGEAWIILAYERNPKDLHMRAPNSPKELSFGGKGVLPRNTWVTLRWIIENNQTRVEVDGVERATVNGKFEGKSGSVGVGTFGGGSIEIKSLTVESTGDSNVPAITSGAIEISVPTKPPSTGHPAPTTPPAPDSIERPEFQSKAKRLEKSITSVTSMMVQVAPDGQTTGFTSDVIGTIPSQSRDSKKAGIGFYRPDVDTTMKAALEEAARAVLLRYPYWEPGHIDISFGEKFVSHGGPSAGTAFALLMLSSLEDFTIDPRCALTGDITVDWKVRKVGAVTAKLRGATLDKCLFALIPEGNEAAFADMAILYGNSSLCEIQVFSIATLHDAIALARTDRAPRLLQAIKLFDELRPNFIKDEKAALKDPHTRDTLKQILELAPNHLSAKYLLAITNATASKTLSVNGSLYQLSMILYPYRSLLTNKQPINRDTLPAYVTVLARKRLAALRLIAAPELQPLLIDAAAYIEAFDGLAARVVSNETFTLRARNLEARALTLDKDPNFMERLVREGY